MTENPQNPSLEPLLEALLLAADTPLSLTRLAEVFDETDRPSTSELQQALQQLQQQYQGRGIELVEVASGWRIQVCARYAPWVNRLWEEKPQRYSRAFLETLALIAYQQPITRGDIEDIRGVAVNTNIIKTLLERQWIKEVGHREVPGRPALLATTPQFLDYFNLSRLSQLPPLAQLTEVLATAEPAAQACAPAEPIEETLSPA